MSHFKVSRNGLPSALRHLAVLGVGLLASTAALAEECTRDQLAAAVDLAGEQLRTLTAASAPALQAKLARLREINGWADSEAEEKGFSAIEDARTASLDSSANELLARIDQLGGDDATGAAPDCARIAEIESVSLELQATVKAKSQYVLARLDQLITSKAAKPDKAEPPPSPVAPPPQAPAQTPGQTPAQTPAHAPAPGGPAPAASAQPAPPPAAAAPPTAKPPQRWATETKSEARPPALPAIPPVATAPPPAPTPSPAPTTDPAAVDGFTIDEIVDASRGLFGKLSANVARVIEHANANSGRPTGYILGQETGGAFVAGLRYGKGTLYLRSGQSMPIYWHGPSLGADVGAQGTSTLFLIYKIRETSEIISSFSGIEGSAFVVGGLGMTFMSNGSIDMAPVRSGIGLRVGANLGYIRFTGKPTWNPF